MIIITKDNISNYLTDKYINIIDKNIICFSGLNGIFKNKKNKIIYNHKYYFILKSCIYNTYYTNTIININNNYNDIKIYTKYNGKEWNFFNIIKNIYVYFNYYTKKNNKL